VNTCFFDVFHHPTDQDLASVIANRVNIDLCGVFEKAIDEHGALGGEATLLAETAEASELGHRTRKVVAIVHDLHTATAEHVARSHKDGKANTVDDL
jgi:hypothetical protein